MKKLALYILFIFGALLIPTIATILISGNMGVADIKMGITVEMKNGEKMDGEQFVIGMAASELSYIKEEEALKAWMIVCRTNFVKAASGENSSKKQKNLNLDYVSMKELEENNGRKAYLEIKKKLEDASSSILTTHGSWLGSYKPISSMFLPSLGDLASATTIL